MDDPFDSEEAFSGPRDLAAEALPLFTPELPGILGLAKILPEDFEVEELPAYLPCGEGEHLYLWVEKRGRTTPEVVRALAALLDLSERSLGYAGLKDRQGVTRQWISAQTPRSVPEGLHGEGFRVLASSRHANKLRPGHLLGNRFTLAIRGEADLGRARAILDALEQRGLPNWFGPQRFGRHGDNARLGLALLGLAEHPEAGRARRDRFLRRMALSALQSELFNRVASRRVRAGTLGQALEGDLLQLGGDGRGPLFSCEAPEVDSPRVEAFEVVPTGPLFGPQMRWPLGQTGEFERAVLAEAGLDLASFAPGGDLLSGGRRALRVRPRDLVLAELPEGLRLSFSLPRGAYATIVLRELLKPSGPVAPTAEAALPTGGPAL